MKNFKNVVLEPIYSETVSPERFLKIYAQEKDNIESVKIVPAPLGSKILGRIKIVRKRPLCAATASKISPRR